MWEAAQRGRREQAEGTSDTRAAQAAVADFAARARRLARPLTHERAVECRPPSRMGNTVTNQIVGSVVDDKIEALTGGDEKEEAPKKSTSEKIKEAEEEKRATEARQAAAAERAAANREKANAIRAKYGLQQKQ